MRLLAMDIPDDPPALTSWLERHIVGLDLAALVAELEAVHGEAGGSLTGLLGPRLGDVLDEGISALPPELLGQLLSRPRLLLELQAAVLSSGGDHWGRVGAASTELDARADRGRERLAAFLASEGLPGGSRRGALPAPRATPWHRRPWVVSLATAASVLLAVFAFERSRPGAAPTPWGWSRPGAFPDNLPRAAYLDRLADESREWFKERPSEPVALARRLAEFRQGCSALILADHRALPPDDRRWLVGKCREWASRLDAHLADVEAGRDPLVVRAEADATIGKLGSALRAKARDS